MWPHIGYAINEIHAVEYYYHSAVAAGLVGPVVTGHFLPHSLLISAMVQIGKCPRKSSVCYFASQMVWEAISEHLKQGGGVKCKVWGVAKRRTWGEMLSTINLITSNLIATHLYRLKPRSSKELLHFEKLAFQWMRIAVVCACADSLWSALNSSTRHITTTNYSQISTEPSHFLS